MSARHLPVFQFTAYSSMPMQATMEQARVRLDQAGASITDITRFSNKQIVFQLNVRIGDWEAFRAALVGGPLTVEAQADRPDLKSLADEDGDLFGTVTVVISGDNNERADIIPAVPG